MQLEYESRCVGHLGQRHCKVGRELAGRDITAVVLDVHTSIVEGSISAIPRRLMVADADLDRARAVLVVADALGAAGEGARR